MQPVFLFFLKRLKKIDFIWFYFTVSSISLKTALTFWAAQIISRPRLLNSMVSPLDCALISHFVSFFNPF